MTAGPNVADDLTRQQLAAWEDMRDQRDRARAIAVDLEQQLAQATSRDVRFYPGYDTRDDPSGGAAHGMEIHFILRGKRGAITATVNTGWMANPLSGHMRHGRVQSRRDVPGVDATLWHHFPSGSNISSHVPEKRKDWWLGPTKCNVLADGECYGDAGYVIADRFVEVLIGEGEEAAWAFLKDLYSQWLVADGAEVSS